jgi:hypothetical protein
MKSTNFFVSAKNESSLRCLERGGCSTSSANPQGPGRSRRAAAKTAAAFLLLAALAVSAVGRAAAAGVSITSPAEGATVSGVVAINTTSSIDVAMMTIFVDRTMVGWIWPATSAAHSSPWNSANVPNGPHTITAIGYTAVGGANATAAISVVVQNGAAPVLPPPPGVLPTPKPTPAPPGPGPAPLSYPLDDATAASRVVRDPGFEPRPDNALANRTIPTAVELAQVGTDGALDAHGASLIAKVTGNFTGTTDEILQWASYKWAFDPDVTRATAVTESHWHQYAVGDIGNGVSLGILQIKSSDFHGTCDPVADHGGDTGFVNDPLCLSHTSTAFAADYKLAYQRACMDGSISYLSERTPNSGYPSYTSATGSDRLWGCVGNWFSGGWYDDGAVSYIQEVQDNLNNKTWLQPDF